jgi:type VI secretion system protein ImpJ
MRQMQRVLWTKGVLLSPQHLQTQDRFLEDLVSFQLSSLVFCPWGFSRLEIDHEVLAGGLLALTAAAGVFPDGLPFEIPLSDAAPAPKPLNEHWPRDQETLDIYLAIPERRLAGFNISAASSNRGTRYVSEVVLRRDENTGLTEKPIQVARKNFRLLAETELIEGHSSLCVARLVRSAAGGIELDQHFVPPLLDIQASSYLRSVARRLVELLSAKSSSLAALRRQRSQSLADFGLGNVANFWLLYTVNTHLPRLRHVYETRQGHPAALFETMLELAGALTTFSATVHPRSFPEYDHTRLGECFAALDQTLRTLLETVVPANHVALPLRRTEEACVYAAAIDQDALLSAPEWYLAVTADMKPDELLKGVPQRMKVTSADLIEQSIRQAVPGIPVRHVASPPSAVPIKLDYQYFLLERSGRDWDAIRRARNLAVYVPADFAEPQLELVILLPQN